MHSYLFAISFFKIISCCQVASNYILRLPPACQPVACNTMWHSYVTTTTHAVALASVFLRNGLTAQCVWNDNKLTHEQSSLAANAQGDTKCGSNTFWHFVSLPHRLCCMRANSVVLILVLFLLRRWHRITWQALQRGSQRVSDSDSAARWQIDSLLAAIYDSAVMCGAFEHF